jgi:hypothetical protein
VPPAGTGSAKIRRRRPAALRSHANPIATNATVDPANSDPHPSTSSRTAVGSNNAAMPRLSRLTALATTRPFVAAPARAPRPGALV